MDTTISSAFQKVANQATIQAQKPMLLDPKPMLDRAPFEKRWGMMRDDGVLWQPAWKDIQRFIAPTRGMFWGNADQIPNDGRAIDHKTMIDGHAMRALNTLASGMTSGLTSPSRPWFRLGAPDPGMMTYAPIKEWLMMVQERMATVFSRSNIYGVLNSCYHEIGAFGTASLMILEDYKTVIRGRNFTIGEYFLGTGPDCRVNAFGRRYKMKASAAIKEFGIDNVSSRVKNSFQNNAVDEWVTIKHLIEPNDERSPNLLGYKGKPWRSAQWEETSTPNTFLRLAGFDEFPVMAPRWDTTTTADIYGRGPGWHALGDVKMLQKMQKDKLMAMDKVVNPPMQADGNVADDVNLLPGGLTRSSAVSQNAGLRPAYQIQPDFNMIEGSIKVTKSDIDAFFYADLFMMIAQADRPDMTAREIVERHEEKLTMLGPVLDRLQSELLGPMIDRVFYLMARAGIIPPPPVELQGQELHVEYISMLAQAQKMVGTAGLSELMRFAGSLAGVFPDIVDRVDADEAVKAEGDMLGVPSKVIRSDDDVAKIRQDKAQAAQAAQSAAVAEQMAGGAKVLSETKLNNGSALDAVMGNQPAPQP